MTGALPGRAFGNFKDRIWNLATAQGIALRLVYDVSGLYTALLQTSRKQAINTRHYKNR
jgi:hypothetical protein